VLTQTQAPPPKMSVTDTGSSPKSLLFYYIWMFVGSYHKRHDDATPPALVAVVSYQFTTDLPLPSTLEAFKFNLSKIDIFFDRDLNLGPSTWQHGSLTIRLPLT
jgi:hypothetical protein